MADLRARFIEDYAGGLLNISRQELSSSGEILSHDGLSSEQTIFIEDGTGTKSGLKIGVGLAECVDPTTQMGLVNVRFADRTYTKIKDTKVFLTAVASAQAALSDAVSTSISNIENAIELLDINFSNNDRKISTLTENFDEYRVSSDNKFLSQGEDIETLKTTLEQINVSLSGDNLVLGAYSLTSITRGAGNISFGINSLKDMTSGSDNIFIGNDISGLSQGTNNIFIGSDIISHKENLSNEIIIGNSNHQNVNISGEIYTPGVQENASSTFISSTNALEFILKLNPIKTTNKNGREDFLFNSQELRDLQGSYDFPGLIREDDSIAKLRLIPIIIAAIQRLNAQIN